MASARQLSPYLLLPIALNFVGCDKLALSEHTEVPIKTTSPGDDLPLDDGGGGFVPSQPAGGDGGALSDAGADAEVPTPACGYGPATDRAFSKTALLQSFAEC